MKLITLVMLLFFTAKALAENDFRKLNSSQIQAIQNYVMTAAHIEFLERQKIDWLEQMGVENASEVVRIAQLSKQTLTLNSHIPGQLLDLYVSRVTVGLYANSDGVILQKLFTALADLNLFAFSSRTFPNHFDATRSLVQSILMIYERAGREIPQEISDSFRKKILHAQSLSANDTIEMMRLSTFFKSVVEKFDHATRDTEPVDSLVLERIYTQTQKYSFRNALALLNATLGPKSRKKCVDL